MVTYPFYCALWNSAWLETFRESFKKLFGNFISEESIKYQILKWQLWSVLRHTYTDRTENDLICYSTVWLCDSVTTTLCDCYILSNVSRDKNTNSKGYVSWWLGIVVSSMNYILPLLNLRYFYVDFGECAHHILGSALVKVGTTEKKLGQAERDLKAKCMSHFLHQLKTFLDGDMKTILVSRCDAIWIACVKESNFVGQMYLPYH